MKRSRLMTVVVMAVLLALLAACSGGGNGNGGDNGDGASEAERRGGDIVVAIMADPDTLDSAATIDATAYQIFSQIYEPLVGRTKAGHFEGILADSWAASEDATVWRFKLREGLVFSSGNPVNADAVVASFARFLDPENPSPSTGQLGPVVSVDKVDELTVEFTLAVPYALLLDNISNAYFGIVDPAALAEYGDDFGRNPVGSGPWKLADWRTGDRIVLVPNERHVSHRSDVTNTGPPLADTLTFRVLGQVETQLAGMDTGDINVMTMVPPDRLDVYYGDPNFEIFSQHVNAITYLSFGMDAVADGVNAFRAPFDDIRVRQALGYALDLDPIIEAVYHGSVVRNHSPMPVSVFGFDASVHGFDHDAAKANALLDEAGWTMGADGVRTKDGTPLEVEFWVIAEPALESVAEVLQSQAAQVGMKLNITSLDTPTYLSSVADSDMNLELLLLGWPAPNILDMIVTLGWGTGLYNNPDLMETLGEAVATVDEGERRALYEKAQHIIVDDTAMIPLWTPSNGILVSSKLKGFTTDVNGHPMYEDVYVTK